MAFSVIKLRPGEIRVQGVPDDGRTPRPGPARAPGSYVYTFVHFWRCTALFGSDSTKARFFNGPTNSFPNENETSVFQLNVIAIGQMVTYAVTERRHLY